LEVALELTSVHIYPLSRLVHALPGDWERDLKALQSGKVRAYAYYQPLREAAVLYCKSRGSKYDELLNQLEKRSRAVAAPRGADPAKDNISAFKSFVDHFHPRLGKFMTSLLNTDTQRGCEFAGLRLLGTPHFVTLDADGQERYVFLLASKWDDDDLKAYMELLAIIVKNRFGASSESIWCMDLRTGQDFKWRASSRMRARCEKAATLYARFTQLMATPGVDH